MTNRNTEWIVVQTTTRAPNAGWDMVREIVNHWVDETLPLGLDGYAFAKEFLKLLRRLENDGFMVVLKQECACDHCGKRWPRKAGDHLVVGLCEECELLWAVENSRAYKAADAAQDALRRSMIQNRTSHNPEEFWDALRAFAEEWCEHDKEKTNENN